MRDDDDLCMNCQIASVIKSLEAAGFEVRYAKMNGAYEQMIHTRKQRLKFAGEYGDFLHDSRH